MHSVASHIYLNINKILHFVPINCLFLNSDGGHFDSFICIKLMLGPNRELRKLGRLLLKEENYLEHCLLPSHPLPPYRFQNSHFSGVMTSVLIKLAFLLTLSKEKTLFRLPAIVNL